MKSTITLNLICGLLMLISTSCFSQSNQNSKVKQSNVMSDKDKSEKSSKNSMRIKTVHGDILIKLLPQVAPNTVERIKKLVSSNFYNGLTFHRVIPGFVVQGGDPKGNGSGGSGVKLKAEFSKLKHKEGTVAMARSSDPDSADSQFYISFGPQPHLDGKYTIFGEVTEGMENAKKLQKGNKMILVTLE